MTGTLWWLPVSDLVFSLTTKLLCGVSFCAVEEREGGNSWVAICHQPRATHWEGEPTDLLFPLRKEGQEGKRIPGLHGTKSSLL